MIMQSRSLARETGSSFIIQNVLSRLMACFTKTDGVAIALCVTAATQMQLVRISRQVWFHDHNTT